MTFFGVSFFTPPPRSCRKVEEDKEVVDVCTSGIGSYMFEPLEANRPDKNVDVVASRRLPHTPTHL